MVATKKIEVASEPALHEVMKRADDREIAMVLGPGVVGMSAEPETALTPAIKAAARKINAVYNRNNPEPAKLRYQEILTTVPAAELEIWKISLARELGTYKARQLGIIKKQKRSS